jgi:hypothetical protein
LLEYVSSLTIDFWELQQNGVPNCDHLVRFRTNAYIKGQHIVVNYNPVIYFMFLLLIVIKAA